MKTLTSSPKPPDPYQVAGAQSSADLSSALGQSLLNQMNQVTPEGSLTYTQTGTSSYYDPLLKKQVTLPRFTATQKLSPEGEALRQQELQFDKMYNDIALAQTGRIGTHLSEPFDYNAGEYEGWAGNLYDTLNKESNQRQSDALDQKLKSQGLMPGSAAYDDAMKNTVTAQNRDRTAFMLDAYNTGLNTALTMRNQPINEISALISGGQVQQPSFVSTPQSGVGTPDIAGAIQNTSNQQV